MEVPWVVALAVAIGPLCVAAVAQEPKTREKNDEGVTGSPVMTKRYTWAEAEAAIARLQEARATYPQAQSPLAEWYNFISDPAFSESQEVPEHCVKLGIWMTSRPDSPIPLLAQAKARINHAWQLRGYGSASTARNEERFLAEMAKARQLLEQAVRLRVKDGEAHTLLLEVARAEGRSLDETKTIFESGRSIDATYVWLYSAMAEYLLPRWHGKRGDVEKFALESVRKLPGEDGLDVYGHIAYVVNQYDGNMLFWGDYDRKMLAQAAEVLVKRYPNTLNVVPFAALCTIVANDHHAARRIRPYVNSSDVPRVKVWKNVAADYFRWCAAEEVAAGQCTWLWGTPLNYGNILFSGDSQSVYCPSGLGRASVCQFDTAKGTVQRAFSAKSSQVFCVADAPRQKWLVGSLTGENFQGWVRWDLSGDGEADRHPTKESCQCLAIHPSGEKIAWAEAKTVRIFDVATRKVGSKIDLEEIVERLKFSADGKRLAIAAGSISVHDAVTGKSRYTLPGFQTQPRGKIACEHLLGFDDAGRIWATAFVLGAKPAARPLVRFAAGGKTWDTIMPNLTGQPASAVLSPDRRLLAIADNNNDPGGAESIQVLDLQSQRLQTRLAGHHNHIESLAFSPNGKMLASVGFLGGPVKIWSLAATANRPAAPATKDLTMRGF
jgi:WD40 repeat protein